MKFTHKSILSFSIFTVFCISGVLAETPLSQKMSNTMMSLYPSYYNQGGKSWDYVTGTALNKLPNIFEKLNSLFPKFRISSELKTHVILAVVLNKNSAQHLLNTGSN